MLADSSSRFGDVVVKLFLAWGLPEPHRTGGGAEVPLVEVTSHGCAIAVGELCDSHPFGATGPLRIERTVLCVRSAGVVIPGVTSGQEVQQVQLQGLLLIQFQFGHDFPHLPEAPIIVPYLDSQPIGELVEPLSPIDPAAQVSAPAAPNPASAEPADETAHTLLSNAQSSQSICEDISNCRVAH
jgi:hypothetical protein